MHILPKLSLGLLLLVMFGRSALAEELPEIQARIDRIEHGLSESVAAKDAPERHMSLRARMAFYKVPAVSIALVNNNKIEWARAYGELDSTGKRPATPESLFQAASVSKAATAIGALRLVEQGKLSLDATANSQLTAWKIPENALTQAKPVSLRMLLNHSAGISVHGFDGYAAGKRVPNLLQILQGIPPANSAPMTVDILPGSEWVYSGGGFTIIQLMMIEASKKSFQSYMQTSVLNPLGMSDSSFAENLPAAWRVRAASAHLKDGSEVKGKWHVYPESAAAGLWTTPSDLARVVIAIQDAEAGRSDKLLSQEMTSLMLKRELGEYGLGFFVENLGRTTSFSHSGGNTGFRAQLYGYTRLGKGVVIMTNSDNGAALIRELLYAISAEYDWPEFRVTEPKP